MIPATASGIRMFRFVTVATAIVTTGVTIDTEDLVAFSADKARDFLVIS